MPLDNVITTEFEEDQGLSKELAQIARLQFPAPKRAISAYRQGDHEKGWRAWKKYLGKRRSAFEFSPTWGGKQSPLLWSATDDVLRSDAAELIRRCYAISKGNKASGEVSDQIGAWLAEATDAPPSLPLALECLAWAHVLPRLASVCGSLRWWELLNQLVTCAGDGYGNKSQIDPLLGNLLVGELSVTLASLFPEVAICESLISRARKYLSASVIDMTDGAGLFHARDWRLFRPLLACWTRCQLIATQKCLNKKAAEQYRWMVTHSLRLAKANGEQLLTRREEGGWCKRLFAAAIWVGGDEADIEVADRVLPGREKSGPTGIQWPAVSYQSEWSEAAVMRGKWSRKAPRLAIAHHDARTRLEFEIGRNAVLSGEWDFGLTYGDEPIEERNEWEQTCWESDADVDYLELEMKLTPELRIERSILLARGEQFLLLADAVIGEDDRPIEYQMRLPLADGITAQTNNETYEMNLVHDSAVARVLPLALSEWRCDPREGQLESHSDNLTLLQQGRRALYAPVFIDLSPRRQSKALTWRRLSVGEMRQNLPPSVAVGHRIQIGKKQWLLYRCLTSKGNRTVLGQNTIAEFLAARFLPDGELEELIEIE